MKILKNRDLAGVMDQALTSGGSFVLGLLMVNQFGLGSYGEYASIWLIYLFFAGLFHSFITLPSMVLSNKIGIDNGLLFSNRRMADILLLAISPFIIFIIFSLFQLSWLDSISYFVLIVLGLRLDSLRKFFYASNQSYIALVGSSLYLITIISAVFFTRLFDTKDIVFLINFLIIGMIAGNIYYTIQLYKWRKQNTPIHQPLPIKKNWAYGKSLLATNILQWFSGNFIQLAVLSILGNSSLGALRMLQNILGLLHIIFLTLENIIPSKSSQILNSQGKSAYALFMKNKAIKSGFIFVIALLILLIFPKHLLALFYSSEMIEYTLQLQQFSLIYILVFSGTWFQLILKTNSKNNGILVAYIGTLLLGFLCAKPLVQVWGLSGAIITFGILQLFTNSIYFFSIKKHQLV